MHSLQPAFAKVFLITAFAIPLIAGGCTSRQSEILTGDSTVSIGDAVQKAQALLSAAEARGCHPLALASGSGVGHGTGVGVGFVVQGDCANCKGQEGRQREVLRETVERHNVSVLVSCPTGAASP